MNFFTTERKCGRIRAGIIKTAHGQILTPCYIPVGTRATVKALSTEDLIQSQVQMFFVNTYHVYLKPGIEIIRKFKGLHNFINWPKPLITDSGGFQIFSLGSKKFAKNGDQSDTILTKVNDDGVIFRSHWDGSEHLFNARLSMEYQWFLGSDIHIAFDECLEQPASHEKTVISMERTHKWALESLKEHKRLETNPVYSYPQYLYGVIQGGIYEDLRQKSARFITGMDFDGFAVGGLSVGESKNEMSAMLESIYDLLPDEKPRHLLGVGDVLDIFTAVESGMDTFDCVEPTRLGRMGTAFVRGSPDFRLDLTKSIYKDANEPIEKGCRCQTCKNYSKGYINHLFRTKELLGYRLLTMHNLHFVINLTSLIRQAILSNTYESFKKEWQDGN